jgi:hypothetical protein
VLEASINGVGTLDYGSDFDWWTLMLLRGGATASHALGTGMLALALYYERAEHRLRPALLLFAGAVCVHALWNALALLVSSGLIYDFEELTGSDVDSVILGLMSPLALAEIAALYLIARWAYRSSPKQGDQETAGLAPVPPIEPAAAPVVAGNIPPHTP